MGGLYLHSPAFSLSSQHTFPTDIHPTKTTLADIPKMQQEAAKDTRSDGPHGLHRHKACTRGQSFGMLTDHKLGIKTFNRLRYEVKKARNCLKELHHLWQKLKSWREDVLLSAASLKSFATFTQLYIKHERMQQMRNLSFTAKFVDAYNSKQ